MPQPSPLSIATSAVTRLLKEELTYRQELSNQETRLSQMQESNDDDDDGNREFNLKQQRTSISETKAIFAPLRERVVASIERLEGLLAESSDHADPKEVEAAREAVSRARKETT